MDSINLTSCLENRYIKNEDQDITYTEDFEDDDTNFTFYYSSPYLILEEDGVSYQEQFKITVDTKELIMYLDEIRTLNLLESEDDEDELDDVSAEDQDDDNEDDLIAVANLNCCLALLAVANLNCWC